MSQALQWKAWLRDGSKTKLDLFEYLAKAPAPLTYIPGPTQLQFHTATERVKQVAGGWRAGKSKSMAAEMLPIILEDNAELWIVANDYKLAEPEFGYIYEWLRWMGAPLDEKEGGQVSMPLNGRWSMRLPWNAKLSTQSAEDIKKLEAANLNIAAMAEAGQMQEAVIDRLRGRVMEKRGTILLSGSLEGASWWYLDQFERYLHGDEDGRWKSFAIPSWENIVMFPNGIEDEEIQHLKNTLPENIFKLKVAAEVAKPQELVFPEFSNKEHVIPIEWTTTDPEGKALIEPWPEMDSTGMRVQKWLLPARTQVEVAVDPGFNGAYAVLFIQKFGINVFVLDEVYLRRVVAQDVIRECRERQFWPYVRGGVIDVAGQQHQGMASHQEIWAEPENGGTFLRYNYVPIPDGMMRLRTFLNDPMTRRPRVWVSPRCVGLISEFSKYRFRLPKENRAEREEPIDSDNHSIKALTYWLVDRFGFTTGGTERRVSSERYIHNARMPWHEGGGDPNSFAYDPFRER